MSLPRKLQRRLAKLFQFVQVWLTPEQAATVQQWDAENRAKALGTHKDTDQ
jgi:Spy/CpxP family protein refolding chaperone